VRRRICARLTVWPPFSNHRIIAAGTLTDIPGIVDAIAAIVTKLYETGTHPSLEKLRRQVPVGLLELFAIPVLRPDKIFKIHEAMFEQLAQCVDQIKKAQRISPTAD
jgi:DNA polymerase (family 10)